MATKQEEVLARYHGLMNKAVEPEKPLANSHIILLGAMSSGKTVAGLTASEQCPSELPASKLTRLEDIAYIPIEAGGLDSLKFLRLEVEPSHVIPYAEILGDVKDPAEALAISVDLARKLQSGGVDKVFGDSISKFDLQVQAYLNSPEGKLLWQGDKYAMFRTSLNAHNRAYNKFVEFKGMRIYAIHPKAVVDDLTQAGGVGVLSEKTKRQDKANGTYAEADLILGLTGGAREIWPKDVSLQIGLQLVKENGKYVRRALTQFDEKSGLAVKSRFEGILDPIERPHLGDMIRKVREFK